MMRTFLALAAAGVALSACGIVPAGLDWPTRPQLNLAPDVIASVAVYRLGQPPPASASALGELSALSCLREDRPGIAQADALQRLQSEAARKGANALIDVRFKVTQGPLAHATCIHRTFAKGTAVVLAR
jgi:hypothetical protein